jgi:hypothetical protein
LQQNCKAMYEHKRQPVASRKVFYKRIAWNLLLAFGVLALSLSIGIAGYVYFEDMPLIDALHNASMILGGMGPVPPDIKTKSGKLFSSFYALFCGVVFITNIGLILTPAIHRILHSLHVEEK